MKPAVKNMGYGGMSEWHRERRDGLGDDWSRGNMFNSSCRGVEDRSGNSGRVEKS